MESITGSEIIGTTSDGFKFVVRPGSDDHLAMGGHETALGPTLSSMAKRCHPDDLVVVVGAHVGLWAVRLGKLRQVVAYEANAATAATLGRNVALNPGVRVEIHSVAVWDRVGEWMHLVDRYDRIEGGSTRVEPDPHGEVWTTTLDSDFITTANRVGLIVMDVEGAEAAVLRGARDVLLRDRPSMVIEMHVGHPGTPPDLREQVEEELTETHYEWTSLELTGERYICRPLEEGLPPDFEVTSVRCGEPEPE